MSAESGLDTEVGGQTNPPGTLALLLCCPKKIERSLISWNVGPETPGSQCKLTKGCEISPPQYASEMKRRWAGVNSGQYSPCQ